MFNYSLFYHKMLGSRINFMNQSKNSR